MATRDVFPTPPLPDTKATTGASPSFSIRWASPPTKRGFSVSSGDSLLVPMGMGPSPRTSVWLSRESASGGKSPNCPTFSERSCTIASVTALDPTCGTRTSADELGIVPPNTMVGTSSAVREGSSRSGSESVRKSARSKTVRTPACSARCLSPCVTPYVAMATSAAMPSCATAAATLSADMGPSRGPTSTPIPNGTFCTRSRRSWADEAKQSCPSGSR